MQIFIAPSGEPFRVPADQPYPVADWFARADANHDGKLTEAEFTADFLGFFAKLDRDQDGVIDAAELERYERTTPELRTGSFAGWSAASEGEGEDADGNKRARSLGSFMGANDPQGAGRFNFLRIPEPVASMDTELKGRITRDQARDAADYRFSLLDDQHRGYLTLAGLPQTYAQTHRGASGHEGHHRRGRRGN
jgi:Ca2+-binding EF-hand superfamily protein